MAYSKPLPKPGGEPSPSLLPTFSLRYVFNTYASNNDVSVVIDDSVNLSVGIVVRKSFYKLKTIAL